MKNNDFAWYLSSFLTKYLAGEKRLSINTIAVYRDTFKLFLLFCDKVKKIPAERITLLMFNKTLILEYLDWIENERAGAIATRNQRLSSIRGFIKYVQSESPDNLFEWGRILGIPQKKASKTIVPYLTEEDLKILFRQPDLNSEEGRRDYALLIFMYDTAARVQELCDLKMKDIRIESPAVVTLHGKGNKDRQIPILDKTKNLMKEYMEEQKHVNWGIAFQDIPVFFNRSRQPLSRWGISYILNKYVTLAKQDPSFSSSFPITPHVLRHSKAMAMLKAGINLIYIRDFLGHVNVTTTEVYYGKRNIMESKLANPRI